MKKLIALFLSLVFVLALVGCGKAEPSNLRVYSFSGADGLRSDALCRDY